MVKGKIKGEISGETIREKTEELLFICLPLSERDVIIRLLLSDALDDFAEKTDRIRRSAGTSPGVSRKALEILENTLKLKDNAGDIIKEGIKKALALLKQ